MSIFNYAYAILKLKPEAMFDIVGDNYDTLKWYDKVQHKPSEIEIKTKIAELEKEYARKAYQRKREPEYPTVTEQLDMLWHAIDSDSLDKNSDFYKSLKSIKDKYPKGNN